MRSNLNGFPIDGSVGSQIKYDIFAQHMSKAMSFSNGIVNYGPTLFDALGVIGVFFSFLFISLGLCLSLIIGVIWIIGFLIKTIINKLFVKYKK